MIQTYFDKICQEWNYVPAQEICTGYESVINQLKSLGKQNWQQQNDAGKEAMQQQVFDIYRSVGIVPINYYNLEGCRTQLNDLATKTKSVQPTTRTLKKYPRRQYFYDRIPKKKHHT